MTESEMIKNAMSVCLQPLNVKYRPIIKKALEDVIEYRKIGTVDQCRKSVGILRDIYKEGKKWEQK